MKKTCKICNITETSKWLSGPLCRKCYRKLPHIKKRESQSRLKRIDYYNNISSLYAQNNKEQIAAKNKEHYEINKEKQIIRKKQYRKDNKKILNIKNNEWQIKRRKENINFKLRCILRSRLSKALKNNQKSGSAIRDLGCIIPELKKHIENQFQLGMNWNNYGLYGWHIDHIIPLFNFDLSNSKEFKKACHYTNLQPLWAKDNLSKGGKI